MLPWYFCGNIPKSHLPLKLYARLMLVLLVTCGSQIFSAHQPLNICDGVSVWWKKNKGKKKKGDSASNSTKDMSKLCVLLQPMSVRKIRSLHPSPLKTTNQLHIRLYRSLLEAQVQQGRRMLAWFCHCQGHIVLSFNYDYDKLSFQ